MLIPWTLIDLQLLTHMGSFSAASAYLSNASRGSSSADQRNSIYQHDEPYLFIPKITSCSVSREACNDGLLLVDTHATTFARSLDRHF